MTTAPALSVPVRGSRRKRARSAMPGLGLTLGMTVVDLREPAGPEVTTQVAFDLDDSAVITLRSYRSA